MVVAIHLGSFSESCYEASETIECWLCFLSSCSPVVSSQVLEWNSSYSKAISSSKRAYLWFAATFLRPEDFVYCSLPNWPWPSDVASFNGFFFPSVDLALLAVLLLAADLIGFCGSIGVSGRMVGLFRWRYWSQFLLGVKLGVNKKCWLLMRKYGFVWKIVFYMCLVGISIWNSQYAAFSSLASCFGHWSRAVSEAGNRRYLLKSYRSHYANHTCKSSSYSTKGSLLTYYAYAFIYRDPCNHTTPKISSNSETNTIRILILCAAI